MYYNVDLKDESICVMSNNAASITMTSQAASQLTSQPIKVVSVQRGADVTGSAPRDSFLLRGQGVCPGCLRHDNQLRPGRQAIARDNQASPAKPENCVEIVDKDFFFLVAVQKTDLDHLESLLRAYNPLVALLSQIFLVAIEAKGLGAKIWRFRRRLVFSLF